jgi:pimeloyl-ACP methyl ester carboxylesterase
MRLACSVRLAAIGAATLFAMSAAAESSLQPVRGARLYVQTSGSGAPLVFLHGGMHHFDNAFTQQRDFFAVFRRVIGVDQRGHGHSPDTDQPFSYREMAEDTAALIQRLAVGPVDIVGHSDGGNVALLVARYHPQLVRKVAVSGANMRARHPPAELKRRSEMPAQQIAERLASFRDDYISLSPDGAEHWPIFATKSWRLWLTPVVIDTAELNAIKAPVLVIAGDHDIVPLEETLEIYRGLPRGQLLILPDTGHDTFRERAEVLNTALRRFFEQTAP